MKRPKGELLQGEAKGLDSLLSPPPTQGMLCVSSLDSWSYREVSCQVPVAVGLNSQLNGFTTLQVGQLPESLVPFAA